MQLTLCDGSAPVKVQMVQNDSGYWKPIGMVDSITAKSGEQELGVGVDARGCDGTRKNAESGCRR